MWVRLPANCLNAFLPKFQFTHPCGCDNGAAVKRQRGNSFNSRTRVGATGPLFHVITVNDVSIHAPVWVRPFDENNLTLYFKFQFTHPCGCDVLSGLPLPRQKGFNSRTRVGATATGRACAIVSAFQFTHPCGCDLANHLKFMHPAGFNSRTRVGATFFVHRYYLTPAVSIHAPVWVRRFTKIQSTTKQQFQFTHPCGCDQDEGQDAGTVLVSIHAPVWVRPSSPGRVNGKSWFQFTHPCGCDHLTIESFNSLHRFNSRTRVGATRLQFQSLSE